MDVGDRERGVELLAWEVIKETDVGQSLGLLGGADFGHARAVANEQEDDFGTVTQPPGGFDKLGGRVGEAEVARIHRHELVRQT